MNRITVKKSECIRCGACMNACIYGAIRMDADGTAVINETQCALCGICVLQCPEDAIIMDGTDKKPQNDSEVQGYQGIMVFAEQWNGEIIDSVLELLSEGRRLAEDLEEELSAVVIGNIDRKEAEQLSRYGAEKVYLLRAEGMEISNEEVLTNLMEQLINRYRPSVVLYSATTFGRSLAPRIAARLRTGLTADCTGLDIDREHKLLLQTRPTFGGNVMATIICPDHRPQMATVRPRVFRKSLPEQPVHTDYIEIDAAQESRPLKMKILNAIETVTETLQLEDAEIVVAGGAGFSSVEEFQIVRQLADALGGRAGASRAAVELGYATHEEQVGQTGKVIAPKVYIACGISGAIQHLIGMENAGYIIAINEDPDAPIFQVADMAVVGDMRQILPELLEAVRHKPVKQLNSKENRNRLP